MKNKLAYNGLTDVVVLLLAVIVTGKWERQVCDSLELKYVKYIGFREKVLDSTTVIRLSLT